MAANSSSNDSLLHSNVNDITCLFTGPSSFVFMSYNITKIHLVLPLCILVLNLGFQRWQKQRSNTTTATTSHSDSFTYHMVAIELIGVLGGVFCICGAHRNLFTVFYVGYNLWVFTWYGESILHMLTCVERYLAVVHPITYLSLKRERGIRIRNITMGCVWLICFLVFIPGLDTCFILSFFFLVFSLIVIAFCSISVLRVLIRSGPGEQGGERLRVDQSKRRAFCTIMVILEVLLLRFFGTMAWVVIFMMSHRVCAMMAADVWFSLPSCLVLPLLFLHRAGKLACCKKNTK